MSLLDFFEGGRLLEVGVGLDGVGFVLYPYLRSTMRAISR
jgi:hypothetical protein